MNQGQYSIFIHEASYVIVKVIPSDRKLLPDPPSEFELEVRDNPNRTRVFNTLGAG